MVDDLVSLSKTEATTLCRRVYSARGFPHGVDTVAAEAAVWIALQNIYSLGKYLFEKLTCHCDASVPRRIERLSDCRLKTTLDRANEFLGVLETVDLLAAMCSQASGNVISATIENMSNWIVLLPILQRNSLGSTQFELTVNSRKIVVRDGELWGSCELADFVSTNSCTALIECKDNLISYADNNIACLASRRLDIAFNKHTVSTRILVEKFHYQEMKKIAFTTFVPPSERSRTGAGPEVDDND